MAPIGRALRQHGYVTAIVAVVLATSLFFPLRPEVDFAHLSWLYLCVVGFVAWSAGTGPAFVAAVLSFAAGNYVFTLPYGTFAVAEPLDLIQLGVFFIGAAVVGLLTGRVRERELAAVASERDATALAKLASEMAEGHDPNDVIDSAVTALMTLPDVETAVVWMPEKGHGLVAIGPGERFVASADRTAAMRSFERVKAINLQEARSESDRLGTGWPAIDSEGVSRSMGTFIPLVSSSENEGVLQIVSGTKGLDTGTSALAVSISQLLAVFISSLKAVETAARVQGAAEAARVKSVIVSAVSHELKTPLAAAMAAVTDLVSEDVAREPDEVQRTLSAVAEDLRRLQIAISDLLDLSRLQSDEWMPHPELYEAGEILGDVVSVVPKNVRDRLVYRVRQKPSPDVYADFAQVSRALRAVLDNALTYSPEMAAVFLGAERRDDRTVLWIEDRGPGVSDQDKPFVFDRAYRGAAGVRRPGSTGLGLTIARDLIEANAGYLSVEDALPSGTRILVDLPALPPAEG